MDKELSKALANFLNALTATILLLHKLIEEREKGKK